MKAHFDTQRFRSSLDAVRMSKGLSWRAVARETGISVPTVCRIANGDKPNVDNLVTLLVWSGLDTRAFCSGIDQEVI